MTLAEQLREYADRANDVNHPRGWVALPGELVDALDLAVAELRRRDLFKAGLAELTRDNLNLREELDALYKKWIVGDLTPEDFRAPTSAQATRSDSVVALGVTRRERPALNCVTCGQFPHTQECPIGRKWVSQGAIDCGACSGTGQAGPTDGECTICEGSGYFTSYELERKRHVERWYQQDKDIRELRHMNDVLEREIDRLRGGNDTSAPSGVLERLK